MSLIVGVAVTVTRRNASTTILRRTSISRQVLSRRTIDPLSMATLLEPPALLAIGVTLAATAGALYAGLRRPVPDQPVEVTGEHDEAWGADDPPRAAKRSYVYPPEPVAVEVATSAAPETRVELLRNISSTEVEPSVDEELIVQDEDHLQDQDEEEVSLADLMRRRPDAKEDR